MYNRNKYVQEYYIDIEGNWELKDTYMVLKNVITIKGEALICEDIKVKGTYKVFLIQRAKNTSRAIINVELADDETHIDAMNFM